MMRSMETRERKTGLKAVYKLCPVAHTVALLSALVILLHLALRDNQTLMARIAAGFLHPLHERLAQLWDKLGYYSAAEALIWGFIAFLLAALSWRLVKLIRGDRRRNFYRLILLPVSAALFVYAGYSALWGTYYYADDFLVSGGFDSREISVDELEVVTRYFAARLNEYGDLVQRDEQGLTCFDRQEILARSREIYSNTEALHPRLAGPAVSAKAIAGSRWLSYLDFTGFFFPFTGEACVNTDFPASLFPSTVAHELAHQRGVAREQDANFVAVLSSLESGDLDYSYSACLLAYIHLGNALYTADYARWEPIYKSLSEGVRLDIALNNHYWQQFETPVQTVSNTVHEGLLQSYGQQLGLKSYGACVDLLVCHYLSDAQACVTGENQG